MTKRILYTRANNYIVSTIHGKVTIGPEQYETMVFLAQEDPNSTEIEDSLDHDARRCNTLEDAITIHCKMIQKWISKDRPIKEPTT